MTGAQTIPGRARPAPRGPQVVAAVAASTSFANSLTTVVRWAPNDWIYVVCFGRQGATFSAPSNVGTWTQIYANATVGGVLPFVVYRAQATTTSGGSNVTVTRGGNSVGWGMRTFVVRGADTTNPNGDVVPGRPGPTSQPNYVYVAPSIDTPGGLMLMDVVQDTGAFSVEPNGSMQNLRASSFVQELGDQSGTIYYTVNMIPTTGTCNWSPVFIPIRAA